MGIFENIRKYSSWLFYREYLKIKPNLATREGREFALDQLAEAVERITLENNKRKHEKLYDMFQEIYVKYLPSIKKQAEEFIKNEYH